MRPSNKTNPDFWRERWRLSQIGWHRPDVHPLLAQGWSELGVEPASPVFVPLCGKSVDMAWLVGRGHRVLGIDISAVAIETFIAEQQLDLATHDSQRFQRWSGQHYDLLAGDFFALKPADLTPVQAVYDRAALVAFEPAERLRYAAHMQAIVPPHAAILLITLDYDQGDMEGPPFAVSDAEVDRLFGERYSIRRLARSDILTEEPRFRERGLSGLTETLALLRPLS